MTSHWLTRALEESRARGFLGPGPLDIQVEHARGFAAVWEQREARLPRMTVDLGSGGGLPGLVLLERWRSPMVFVDSMIKRTSFLLEVLGWPDAPAEAVVANERAESAARDARFEGVADLVTARSFASPAVTAECAVRFLAVGGRLIVSEPPELDPRRWPVAELAELGLEVEQSVRAGAHFQVLVKVRPTADRYPRGVGVPGRRPLY